MALRVNNFGGGGAAPGTITGAGVANQVAVWSAPSVITGYAGYTYDGNTLYVNPSGVNTGLNFNAAVGYTGKPINYQINGGASVFYVDYLGNTVVGNSITANGSGTVKGLAYFTAWYSDGGAGKFISFGSAYAGGSAGINFGTSNTIQGAISTAGNWTIGSATDFGVKLYVSGTFQTTGTATIASNVTIGSTGITLSNFTNINILGGNSIIDYTGVSQFGDTYKITTYAQFGGYAVFKFVGNSPTAGHFIFGSDCGIKRVSANVVGVTNGAAGYGSLTFDGVNTVQITGAYTAGAVVQAGYVNVVINGTTYKLLLG